MKATPQEIGAKLKEALGTETPTAKQLWALVVFAKHVRLRARNNTAFNNLMNGAFPNARFNTVQKERYDGTKYPGLSITIEGQPGSPYTDDEHDE